jgi:hypothetical protein
MRLSDPNKFGILTYSATADLVRGRYLCRFVLHAQVVASNSVIEKSVDLTGGLTDTKLPPDQVPLTVLRVFSGKRNTC